MVLFHESMVLKVAKLTIPLQCSFQCRIEFVKNYALVFGLPQPAALRGRANQAPTYLHADQNHKIVHQKYRQACSEKNEPYMQYRSFFDTWHHCVPHIRFMTPRTDVCKTCEDHRSAIQTAVTEDDKKRSLSDISLHLEEAQKERTAIEKSKLAVHPKRYTHITLDFAQQVFLPYHAHQVGPLYYGPHACSDLWYL